MSQRTRNYPDILIIIGLLAAVCSLVIFPGESVSAAKDGLSLSAGVILPSLFPFFVVSSLIIETGTAERIGRYLAPAVRRLFGVGTAGASAFIIGLLGGYPLGAKAVASLYKNDCCTKAEAEQLLGFCSNSGPAFILGACGAGVFANSLYGLLLLFSHIFSAMLVGLLLRGKNRKASDYPSAIKRDPFPTVFVRSVKDSFHSVIDICGFVIFFEVALSALAQARLLPDGFAGSIIKGAIELTSGIFSLGSVTPRLALPAVSFLLGWGGLCVHCQALSFILPLGLKTGRYFAGKLIHGILSAAITFALCCFLSI